VELPVSDDAQEWRWVGEDGVQKAVTEQELIAELSSEALPHYTLVWKKRWLEWLPAMQVAELGWALPPGRAERAVKPRESASGTQPPPPPLYLYPVIKRRAARALDSRPLEEVEIDAIVASNPGESTPASDWSSARPANSDDDVTLVGDGDFVSDRAAGFAEFEPARAPFGRRAYTEEDDGDTHVLPSRPPPPGPIYVGPHSPPPASEAPGPTYDENEIPHIPRPPGSPTGLSAYARFSTDSDGRELELAGPSARPRRSFRTLVAAGVAAVIGVIAALLVVRSLGSKTEPAGDPTTGSSTSAAPAESAEHATTRVPTATTNGPSKTEGSPKRPPCSVVTPAQRVADWAEPLVTPTLAAIPGSARVAVGFGQTDTYAIGVTIDPRTLDRDQVFREFRREKLVSVVPTSKSGKLRFEIIRQGHVLANARAVDATIPFALGATPFSIARLGKKGEPEPIWSLAEADQSTLPRVNSVPNGYAVALRRGKGGTVSVGFLDTAGNKVSELMDVRTDGAFAGTPSLAVADDALLVSFASRAAPTSPWSIVAGSSKLDEAPRRSVKLDLGGGGPGGDRMSPAVGALGGGRWLVQWTEGSAGNRMIRAQVFGRDLAPLTEAANLSPDGANAGQGVVWTSGDLATILFYVKNAKNNNELWGVSLECVR
jgi:hypothetical protein